MKVVVVNDASEARGGATGLALLQARMLAARGIDTVFATADKGGNAELQAAGVRLYAAGSEPLVRLPAHRAATRGLYNPDVRQMIEGVIAKEDGPDTVYHVHSWSKTLTPAVFAGLRVVAARCFIHIHDYFLACPNGGFMDYQRMEPCVRKPLSVSCVTTDCDKRSKTQKAWRVTRQMILRRCLPPGGDWAGFLLIHPGMAGALETSGYPSAKLHPVRNPASALSQTRLTPEASDRLLFIGRVEAEKGVEDLIAAVQAAKVPLTIVGDGPLREPLSQRFPEIRFAGWQDRAGLAEVARDARALVMPSRYPEPFGLVAAEAALSGLPVLLADTALLAEEFVKAGFGWSCDTRDAGAFAALVSDIARTSTEDISAMSHLAMARASEICQTPDAWIDAQLALYCHVLGA